MNTEANDTRLVTYVAVVTSFNEGLMRIWGAEAAYARLACALTAFHSLGRPGLNGPEKEVLQHLDRIQYSSYQAMAHVTDVSHIVYATALLDSLLSDTTVFLFLIFPEAMGKQQVPVEDVLKMPSKTELLTQLAKARARELAFQSTVSRIDFLRQTFGLKIALDKDTKSALVRYAALRNRSVHDQSLVSLQLNDTGSVAASQQSLVSIGSEDVHAAIETYRDVGRAVYSAVLRQVLKSEAHPSVRPLLAVPTVAKGSGDESVH